MARASFVHSFGPNDRGRVYVTINSRLPRERRRFESHLRALRAFVPRLINSRCEISRGSLRPRREKSVESIANARGPREARSPDEESKVAS